MTLKVLLSCGDAAAKCRSVQEHLRQDAAPAMAYGHWTLQERERGKRCFPRSTCATMQHQPWHVAIGLSKSGGGGSGAFLGII